MQAGHDSRSPAGRHRQSAFAAAFLSLLFPGLGQAYLGAYRRALGWAAPPLLVGSLAAGFAVQMNLTELAGIALQTWFLGGVFALNLVVLAYRGASIVDAWLIARAVDAAPTRGTNAGMLTLARTAGLVSIAGLAAIVLVMSLAHVAVARYDLLLAGTADCIFDPDGEGCGPTESEAPAESTAPTPGETATAEPSLGPEVTAPSVPPWDGHERLNILLIGADEQGGGHNTDTLITLSIDPQTNQAVMFQLPRDTVDVPLPPGPLRNFFGSVYAGKINSLYVNVRNRPDLAPGSNRTRGYNALKSVLGELYGLDIKYYVEVNFRGFRDAVDALGGVTVNVQVPVLDNDFPRPGDQRIRLFIPAGMQHMTGPEALDYARSRKSSNDFERGARQQRVLVSLRQQMDLSNILPNIDTLAAAVGDNVRTDFPRELLPQLLGLADKIDARSIRSVIFTPPYYQNECLNCPPRGYIIQPRVERIRAAVREAFTIDPNFAEARETLAEEAAAVWVLNGSGRQGEAATLAHYLSYLGVTSVAPNQKPDTTGLSDTTIRAYNGAEADFPFTASTLAELFGVTIEPISDPTIVPDFVIITGGRTPQLTAPPAP
jgi:LCP family protein required for cell wall assembly